MNERESKEQLVEGRVKNPEECQESYPSPITEKMSLSEILITINGNKYKDLDAFLKFIDWFAINPEEILPRDKIRTFCRSITDIEARLQTMKFLRKYEDYYFKDITGVVDQVERADYMDRTYFEDVYGVIHSVSDFHKELSVMIEQIESKGEFSKGKFDALVSENLRLKSQNETLRKTMECMIDDEQKSPTSTNKNMPCLDAVIEYAKTLKYEEASVIQTMCLALMDISDKKVKKKILAMRPSGAPITIEQVETFNNYENSTILPR